MKKKFAAFVLCVICLLSAAGCGQTKTDEQTPPAADQSTTTDDYLTGIGGTYVELFPELSKSEYRNIWIDATAPLVGAENAEATTDLLLGMCMAEPYGPEAAEKYEADPDSMAFNCYFLGGIDKFVMDGHTITGLDAQGPISCWMRKTKTASSSIRARMKIPASLPILRFHLTPWRPPIIWSSAMQKISATCKAGSRAITPTGTQRPSRRTMIRRPWKMSLSCSPQKICRMQNNCSLRTRLDQVGAHTVFQMRM
jgi:hypothetical protein